MSVAEELQNYDQQAAIMDTVLPDWVSQETILQPGKQVASQVRFFSKFDITLMCLF